MIRGLLTLSNSILCKKEVLGKTFNCNIGGIETKIVFPQYPLVDEINPEIGIINPLLPPMIGAKWKRGEEPLFWGCPMIHPSGSSYVDLLAIAIECEEDKEDENARILYSNIQKWEHSLSDYLVLETKQRTDRDRNITRNNCRLELLNQRGYIPENIVIKLFGDVPDELSYASIESIKKAILYADSNKELLLEYQMLLSAYEARRQSQNRRVILDACSALEITLVRQINEYCQSIGLDPSVLTNKYRYIQERIELLKTIGITIPQVDYKNLIVNPRNAVMHNKYTYPSDEVTDKLMSCVEVFLSHFHVAFY